MLRAVVRMFWSPIVQAIEAHGERTAQPCSHAFRLHDYFVNGEHPRVYCVRGRGHVGPCQGYFRETLVEGA